MEPKKLKYGVGMLILKDGKVLLGRRAKTESRGVGTWSLPGGNIEYGETLVEAGKRETMEECGLVVTSARVICINSEIIERGHYITVGMIAEAFSGEAKALAPEEIDRWEWFPMEKLPDKVFEPSLQILECHREGRINKY